MKWLSGQCGNVWGSMTLGALILGVLSMVPETGHATGRADGARREAPVAAQHARVAAPRPLPVATRSAGCNEALDALALCRMSGTSEQRPGDGAAASAPRAVAEASGRPGPGTVVDALQGPVEAPGRLLPVFAFGLAVAGALLALLGLRAISSIAFPGRASGLRIGVPRRPATAAIAKERLLQFRTLPH